ncbi:uncharacterized protein F5891DRAFT_1128413 [Suillus fuscotomentosus]|uniref:Methyltransferase domain-containing protein n=1 Tax=Suillus fuscotomentosus TaxID=1912939 RepID=A0AAD4E6Z8_9AGAM|nr:uncharacterized protein F5891DRAFT_1128413 [Suillus fuscotomentosus]KAG1900512.1 hypothetical protein F5891DRAFT_1128413 [Suillus fuscotomentosus]
MRLDAAFGVVTDLRLGFVGGLWPTIIAIWHVSYLLFQPLEISRIFIADEAGRAVKKGLITPHAYGVVLDLGAGHGHTVNYLDHSRVTKYVAVEPNVHMHAKLRRTASAAGYNEDNGTLLILPCGAENISTTLSYLPAPHPPVDTLISVLTLCSIPSPQSTISSLAAEVLKPGGQILFYEHVLSEREDTSLWGIDVGGWVQGEGGIWGKEGEAGEHLFWHRVGRLVKA